MNTVYGVPQFMEAARKRRAQVLQEIRETDAEIATWQKRRNEAAALSAAALADLAAAIVPDFTPASFGRAARFAGFRKLADEDPLAKREEERRGLQEWIAKIGADPRYADRVKLRDPRVGQLTRKIAELEEFRAPYAETLASFAHPRLARLIESNYGTDAYGVPVWRLSYYADWKAGDEILEKLPEGTSFEEVRRQWLEATRAVADYDAPLELLRAEVKAGEELEARYDAAVESLKTLDERHLAMARTLVGKHVEQTTVATLAPMLAVDPHLELLAKKFDGLAHKVVYLDELGDKQLVALRRELEEERRKLDRDLIKYARPKKAWERFPGDKFERRFHGRDARFRKRIDRYRNGHERVWAYDDWRRPSFAEEFLWWDVMTDGRIDGDFIPQVGAWHSQRPGYSYRSSRHDDDYDRASEAVAGADRGIDADGSRLGDPS